MIGWLLTKWRNRHDPTAVMQTLPTPDGAYSYAKAKAGYERSRRQSETGRMWAKPKREQAVKIIPIRKVGR